MTDVKKIEVKDAKKVTAFKLTRDFVIGGKQYKRNDSFTHANKKVVDYLLTNKIIQ